MLNAWSKIWCLYTFAIESQKAMQYKCLVNMGQTLRYGLGVIVARSAFGKNRICFLNMPNKCTWHLRNAWRMYSNPLGTLTKNAELNLTNKILAFFLGVSDYYLLVNAVSIESKILTCSMVSNFSSNHSDMKLWKNAEFLTMSIINDT